MSGQPSKSAGSQVCTPVCSARPCVHDGVEQKHDRDHVLCEHCTVSVIWCRECQTVGGENINKLLSSGGWTRVNDAGGMYYLCPNDAV